MRARPEVFQRYDIRGEAPEEIDSELVFQLGKALGFYWDSGNILVGRDIRESSPAFYNAMISGLLSQGCDVTATGLATTDMTAYLARKDFDAAVQITASHMPPSYGGFKPINSEGRILSNAEMAEIKKIYMREKASAESYGELSEENLLGEYIEGLVSRYRELFDKDLSGLEVIVDCSNSVGCLAAPDALRELGAEVKVINDSFDPDFSAHSPEPSEKSSEMLQEKVLEEEADIGVIFDGDADRVMFVDENGNFVDGDTSLALLSEKYLEVSEKIVASVNAGRTVKDTVESNDGEISYAPVGAVFTALKSLEENITFGGQPNGHLMDSEFVPYDSGSLFALLVSGLISEKDESFSEIIHDLEKYDTEKFNSSVEEKNDLMLRIREKANARGLIIHEKFNALKLDFEDFTALLRPSGSEELIRVTLEGENISEENISEVREFIADLE
ncbi:hypothetical protein ACK3SF_00090 [Candidatus Nanosalina sp. VS9-1]|uniref:hypothetical protein n=1 Tax=Candidatus Nanosalina sp. VS9-1 TaxID=3388566 RepID=UPI0039E1D553